MLNYFTVKQMAKKHPAFSEASFRYHIFNAEANGFKKVIKRIGRKVLLNEGRFIEWVENHDGGIS